MVGRSNAEVAGSKAEAVISRCYEALHIRYVGENDFGGSERVQSSRGREELKLHVQRKGKKECLNALTFRKWEVKRGTSLFKSSEANHLPQVMTLRIRYLPPLARLPLIWGTKRHR